MRATQLFANHSAQNRLERLLLLSNKESKRVVDLGLVIPASRRMGLVSKPSKDVLIQSDGDTGFAGARGNDGAAFRS